MVILIYPMFSNKTNLNADSTYIVIKRFIESITKKRPDWYFLYLFPTNIDWVYRKDNFFEKYKNVIRIPFNIPTNKKQMVVNFEAEAWRQINMKYAYDVIVNHTPEITANILPQFQAVTKEGCPFIINQLPYIVHTDLPYAMTELGDRGITLLELAGTMAAHLNVYYSINAKRMNEDNFKKTYGNIPTYKNEVIYFGFDKEQYDSHMRLKNEVTTFIYNHRLQSYKNWRDTFEVFDRLYEDKLKFKVLMTSVDKNSVVDNKPYVVFPPVTMTHDEYLDYVSVGHINTINSQHETFCQSIADSILLEQVVVVPRKATFPELVPEGYPYIFDNKEQQYLMLRELILNREKLNSTAKSLKEFFCDKFSETKYSESWIKIIEENIDDREKVKNSLKKKKEADLYFSKIPNELPARSLFKNMHSWIGQDQAFPIKKLKTIINAYGFKDKFINSEQYFIRKET